MSTQDASLTLISPVIRSPKKRDRRFTAKAVFITRAGLCTDDSKCIEWPWGRFQRGYGRWQGVGAANRIALAVKLGRPLMRTEQAQHTCDNPPCCNGAHLKIGGDRENMRDAISRGRAKLPISRTGSAHHSCKLTPEQVRKIRGFPRTRFYSSRKLAKIFGVTDTAIDKIRNYQTWRNVT